MDNLYQNQIRDLIIQYFKLLKYQLSVGFSKVNDKHQIAFYRCEKQILDAFSLPHKVKHSLFLFHRAKKLIHKEFHVERLYYELSVIASEQLEDTHTPTPMELLKAKENRADAFEYLPDLSLSTDSYTLFIYNEIFMKEQASVEAIWQELQLIKILDCQFDIYLLCFDIYYEENPIYEELKSAGLKFLPRYLKWFHFEYQH